MSLPAILGTTDALADDHTADDHAGGQRSGGFVIPAQPIVIPAQAGIQFGANGGRASKHVSMCAAAHEAMMETSTTPATGVIHFFSTTMPGFYELLILAALIGLPLLFVAAIVFIVVRLTRK